MDMGTAAVFAIDSNADGSRRWKNAVCMTSDGFLMNLRTIADNFIKEMGVRRNFVANHTQVTEIMNNLIAHDDGLFIDSTDNACWVSYSAEFNPFTKTLTLYEGMFEIALMQYRYYRKRWVAVSLNPNDILFTVDAVSRSRCLTETIYATDANEARNLMQQFHILGGDYKYVVTPVKVRTKVAA